MMKSLALQIPQIRRLWEDRGSLREERDRLLALNAELSKSVNTLPPGHMQAYPGYHESQIDILQEFRRHDLRSEPGFITDFIGTRFAIDILWEAASGDGGRIFGVPLPADFHAEAIEWIGVLNAVKAAQDRFTVIELGAGFGTWAICSAVAARSRDLRDIRIYMVEGDPRHCQSARAHFQNNGFNPDEHHIIHAAVGAENGTASWPKPIGPASSDGWNNRPRSDGETDYLGRDVDDYMDVRVVAFRDLLAQETKWDLVHMDIQGHEVEVVRSCLDSVCERVGRIVVGTHSRKLDGDFMQMMREVGWVCENEKPARVVYRADAASLESMTVMDGTQVWRNPRL